MLKINKQKRGCSSKMLQYATFCKPPPILEANSNQQRHQMIENVDLTLLYSSFFQLQKNIHSDVCLFITLLLNAVKDIPRSDDFNY